MSDTPRMPTVCVCALCVRVCAVKCEREMIENDERQDMVFC